MVTSIINSKNKTILVFLTLLLLFLFFVDSPTSVSSSPLWLSMGRAHPLILHFPIVLIIGLFILELVRLYLNIPIAQNLIYWFWVAILFFSMISFLSGYSLYSSGAYAGVLLVDHFNGAKISLACCFLAFIFYILQYSHASKVYPFYMICLLFATVSISFTGHQGGLLTHGSNFLTEYLPLLTDKPGDYTANDSSQYVYRDFIAPLFETKCASCHNNQKKKGNYMVTSYPSLFENGESTRPGIIPHDTIQSELYLRIMSGEKVDGHMPPAGKTPLDKAEKDLIKYWILAGAHKLLLSKDVTLPEFNQALTKLTPVMKQYKKTLHLNRLNAEILKKELNNLNLDLEVIIKPNPEGDGKDYTLSMPFPPVLFDTKKLILLKPYYEVFSKLSLVSSNIEDEDLYYISQMHNLQELYLQKTKLTGKDLIYLKNIPNLKILNLSFTAIDNKSALDLIQFPALEEVYLYQTKVSMDVIKALNEYKPNLRIHAEEGPFF